MTVVMAQPWWSWPLSPWLISPSAAWFIFFNAVVAAIAVMSAGARQQQDRRVPSSSRQRLCRSASSSQFLDQLQAFCLFPVHPGIAGGVTVPPFGDDDDCLGVGVSGSDYNQCSQEAEVLAAPQVMMTQVSTVVSETPWPTTPAAAGDQSVRIAVRSVASSAPSATAAAAEPASAAESKEAVGQEEQDRSISLDEAYAMVQQRRRPRQAPSSPPAASVATTTAASSWSEKTKDRLAGKGPERRRRGREAEEAVPEGKAELNARAELFIRQFREELRLQRPNSLLRDTHAFGPVDGPPMAAVW